MESRMFVPCGHVRAAVGRFVGWRWADGQSATTVAVPSRHLSIIVSLDDPIDVIRMPTPVQGSATFSALVGGLHSSPATVRAGGSAIRLEVSPFAARQLLGLPAGELSSRVVDLAEVWGNALAGLREQLAEVMSWADRFLLMEQFLEARLDGAASAAPELRRAWELLICSGGTMSVHQIASEVGWSRRHLGERFRVEVGLTLKEAARVLRFERACWLLDTTALSLADVAVHCGFADQAHLNREWQRLAGSTPTEWRAQEFHDPRDDTEFPFVQDDGLPRHAHSAA